MIVLRDTGDAEVRMLVRELNGIEAVMRRKLVGVHESLRQAPR